MTKPIKCKVVYNKDNITETLGSFRKANKTQIRIAETEKYPHVTFFFSGGREEPFIGESRILKTLKSSYLH
jgi:2,3-bisphosphoglycerate-independent phosphoglycerate mutase